MNRLVGFSLMDKLKKKYQGRESGRNSPPESSHRDEGLFREWLSIDFNILSLLLVCISEKSMVEEIGELMKLIIRDWNGWDVSEFAGRLAPCRNSTWLRLIIKSLRSEPPPVVAVWVSLRMYGYLIPFAHVVRSLSKIYLAKVGRYAVKPRWI